MSIHSTGLGDDEKVCRGADVTVDGPLAEDLLHGIRAIAQFIGESERRTNYLAERNYIPVGKIGATWTGSKKALREHYGRVTGGTV